MKWWFAGRAPELCRNSRTWPPTGLSRLPRAQMGSWRRTTLANRKQYSKEVAAAVLIGLACVAGGASILGDRWFEDVARRAGVASKHTNRAFKNPYAHIMAGYTALGASAAVADYDGDGYDDIFVTDSMEGGKNHLYHNNGNFTFTDVAEKADAANPHHVHNASPLSLFL